MFTLEQSQLNAVHFLLDCHLEAGRGHDCALLQPDRPTASYAQTGQAAARIASLLHRRGVRPGQPVGLLLPDSQELVFAFLACLKLGAVAVPLNTFSPQTVLRQLLNDCPNAFIVTSNILCGIVRETIPENDRTVTVVCLEAEGDARDSAEWPTKAVTPCHPALWLYTSGSTGQPKAVVHTHGGIVAGLGAYPQDILKLSRRDRCYSTSKCFFAYGLGNSVLFPLSAGASVVLDPRPTNAARVLEMLAQFRPSLFFSVPTVYQRMLNHESMDRRHFQNVRLCLSAGEYLPTTLFDRWQVRTGQRLVDGIGSTEALHIFCSNSVHDARPGTSGKPVAGYQLKIVDDEGNAVPEGAVGQLVVEGPALAAGYWNSPAAQARNFCGGTLRTGDLYWRDPAGNYVYAGRQDDSLKSAGMWVTPIEIEQSLLAQPGVCEAVVVPAQDADGFQVPKAFIVPAGPPMSVTASQQFVAGLLKSLATGMARHKVPKLVELVSELPRTATGKVARHLLRQWELTSRLLPTSIAA